MGDENNAENVYQQMQVYLCPSWALSLGYLGVAAGVVLSNWGSAVSLLFSCRLGFWDFLLLYSISQGLFTTGCAVMRIWIILYSILALRK